MSLHVFRVSPVTSTLEIRKTKIIVLVLLKKLHSCYKPNLYVLLLCLQMTQELSIVRQNGSGNVHN